MAVVVATQAGSSPMAPSGAASGGRRRAGGLSVSTMSASWASLPELPSPSKASPAAASASSALAMTTSPGGARRIASTTSTVALALQSSLPMVPFRMPLSRSYTKDPFSKKSTESLLEELAKVAQEACLPVGSSAQQPCAGFKLGRARRLAAAGAAGGTFAHGSADHYELCGGTMPPSLDDGGYGMFQQSGTMATLRAGQILLPSGGGENDATRSFNSGHRCGAAAAAAAALAAAAASGSFATGPSMLSGVGLSSCSSAPDLGQARRGGLCRGPAAPVHIAERTASLSPRGARGHCRRASIETLGVPLIPPDDWGLVSFTWSPRSSPSNSPRERRPRPPSHIIPKEAPGSPSWRPPVGKDVSWKPTHEALDRSRTVLDALHDVRRAGKQEQVLPTPENVDAQVAAEGEPKPKKKKAVAEEDPPLMKWTLANLNDTSDSLLKIATQLKDGSEPVFDAGGGRHPSNVIAQRTLAVVQKKMVLLRAIEGRFLAFQSINQRREALFKAIVDNTEQAPPELFAIGPFVRKHVHSGCDPIDADKSDFQAFVKILGLPSKHNTIAMLEQLANSAQSWWAAETLALARIATTGADELRRLLKICTGIGAKRTNKEANEEIAKVLGDRVAEQVLAVAESIRKKDDFAVSRSNEPQIESAKRCAQEINDHIREAFDLGAPSDHPSMERAKLIANSLLVEAKARTAQKALIFAQLQQVRDEKAQEAVGPDGIVQVGLASSFADAIEDEIKRAIKDGASPGHEFLKEAKDIAKELRDLDGTRKRMRARADRLQKQAAEGKG